jgi:ribonuclease H / adenosylcobalamin/alpha-ribazole phosphatase
VRRPRRPGRANSDAERRRLAQAHRERPPAKGSKRPVLWCDGGSRGNPGPSAYGYVIEAPGGELLAEIAERLGVSTATTAEYRGLLAGLARAKELGLSRLEMRMDSQLAVAQLNGEREPRNAAIRALLEQAHELAASVGPVRYRWVPRDENGRANRLVADALGL